MTEKSRDEFQDDLQKLIDRAIKGGANADEIATILILTAQDLQD